MNPILRSTIEMEMRSPLVFCLNVWAASVLPVAGIPLWPPPALTAGAPFAQLRPHGRVSRAPS